MIIIWGYNNRDQDQWLAHVFPTSVWDWDAGDGGAGPAASTAATYFPMFRPRRR